MLGDEKFQGYGMCTNFKSRQFVSLVYHSSSPMLYYKRNFSKGQV